MRENRTYGLMRGQGRCFYPSRSTLPVKGIFWDSLVTLLRIHRIFGVALNQVRITIIFLQKKSIAEFLQCSMYRSFICLRTYICLDYLSEKRHENTSNRNFAFNRLRLSSLTYGFRLCHRRRFHNLYGDDKNIYELTPEQIKELYT